MSFPVDTSCSEILLNPYGIDLDPYDTSELLDLVDRILAELQSRRTGEKLGENVPGLPQPAAQTHAPSV